MQIISSYPHVASSTEFLINICDENTKMFIISYEKILNSLITCEFIQPVNIKTHCKRAYTMEDSLSNNFDSAVFV